MTPTEPLSWFEMPRSLIEPALEACRMFNCGLDALFYDMPTLAADLRARGKEIATLGGARGHVPGRGVAPGGSGAAREGRFPIAL